MILTRFMNSKTHQWTIEEKQFILQVCNDSRSWGPKIKETFSDSYDWYIMIWEPTLIQKTFPTIGGKLSLTFSRQHAPTLTVFNALNWTRIPEEAIQSGFSSLEQYKIYLVNHEFGHMLGYGHDTCKAAGALSPVMLQQTKGTQGCLPCVWPKMCGDI